MVTPADKLAQDLRDEIETRYRAAKIERTVLAAAATRIAELDALIAFIEAPTPTMVIAPRPVKPISSTIKPNSGIVK